MKTVFKVIISLLILVAILLVGAAISVAAMLFKGLLFLLIAGGIALVLIYLAVTEVLG